MLEFLKGSFLVLHVSCCILMTFLMMLSIILLPVLMILFSILSVIRHLICGNSLSLLLNLNLVYEMLWTAVRSGLLISMLEKPGQNVASLNLSYRYYFGRCSSELTQLVPFQFAQGRSTSSSDRSHDFSVTIPRCYKDVYFNSFFPHSYTLEFSAYKMLSLTCDLSGFKSRINRHLLTVGSF